MHILDAIGNTSMVRLGRGAPPGGLKHVNTDVYRR